MDSDASISRIGCFDTSDVTNIGGRWIKWLDRFENYLEAMEVITPSRKKALMLHMAGENLFEIFSSLPNPPPLPVENANNDNASDDGEEAAEPAAAAVEDEYESAKRKLTMYFVPKKNLNFEIFNFRQSKQQSNESIDQFYARLLKLAAHCDFSNKDDEIKSQIILTTTSSNLRRYGLREELSLQQLLIYGSSLETTQQQLAAIESITSPSSFVNYNNIKRKKKSFNKNNTKFDNNDNRNKNCKNCGNKWHASGIENCPARNFDCNRCGKHGHFAKVCLSSNSNNKNDQQKHRTQNFNNYNQNSENSSSSNNNNNKFYQRNNNYGNNFNHRNRNNYQSTNHRFAHNLQHHTTDNQASSIQLEQQQMYAENETLGDEQIFNITCGTNNNTCNNNNIISSNNDNNNIINNNNIISSNNNNNIQHSSNNCHNNNNNNVLPKISIEVSGTFIDFTIDTGSSVNIISTSVFKQIKSYPQLIKSNEKIFPYNSNII